MKVLAIETSCDDTGVAVLKVESKKFKVLSNVIASQVKIHRQYGGVFPAMAKREHQTNLVPVLEKSLKESELLNSTTPPLRALTQSGRSNLKKSEMIASRSLAMTDRAKVKNVAKILEREEKLYENLKKFLQKYKKPEVDLIAVTNGPGLEPCLWVGVNFAKALSYFWDIPIVPVNHIEAHMLVNFIYKTNVIASERERAKQSGLFPAVALVVSGGHTRLILMEGIGKYKIIGETRDDAAGECFDKCAKILGLPYPGGPAIAQIVEQWKKQDTRLRQGFGGQAIYNNQTKLPRPMLNTKDYDFSFSGLKTAVLYKVKDKKSSTVVRTTVLDKEFVQEMAVEIQQAIIDVLLKKTIKAAKDYKVKSIILGGGVSANLELRSQFAQAIQETRYNNQTINLLYPPKNLSTDNALMIAVAGYFHQKEKAFPAGKAWNAIVAEANLRIR